MVPEIRHPRRRHGGGLTARNYREQWAGRAGAVHCDPVRRMTSPRCSSSAISTSSQSVVPGQVLADIIASVAVPIVR